MSLLKNIFLKSPSKPFFWIMLGFVIKGMLFLGVILNHPYHDIQGIFGATMGDYASYIVPIDNWLHYGTYIPDFRMPGYGIVYLFFRMFFAQAGACNALLLLQVALASAGVYYLALTAKNIFKSDSIFYLTFYLYLFCSFSNFFDAYISSESLCTSCIIFCVYFFSKYYGTRKNKFIFYAGLLGTWSMFIRPVFGGLVVLFSLLILFERTEVFNVKIKALLLLLIPFFICEGAWICRNYITHKKFVPLSSTSGPFSPESAATYLQPLFEFVQSWGGACSYKGKTIDLDWFQYSYTGMFPITHFDSLPDDIYTSAFNKDSLVALKKMIINLRNPAIDSTTASAYQNQLRTKLNEYRLSVKKEKPFKYYVQAQLKILVVMLFGFETRSYLDRGQSVPLFGKFITGFNYFIYLMILLSGLTGMIGLIIYGIKRRSYLLIIPFIPLYIIMVHVFLFRFHFSRHFMPCYPFLIVCSAFILARLLKLEVKQKPE